MIVNFVYCVCSGLEQQYNYYTTQFTLNQQIFEIINTLFIKTRFYFKGNKLVYIKTIISDDNQQLLKIDYSEKVDSGLFEIPSDYKEM